MAALEIGAGLSSLKTALDIAKSLWTMSNSAESQSKILDLQRAIGEAQFSAIEAREAHAAQIDRVRAFEERIRGFETWESEKERHELKNLGVGAFVYMLKPAMRGNEPPHWICTNCFGDRKISIVQYWHQPGHNQRNFCPSCKQELNPSWEFTDGMAPKWLD